MVQSKIRPSKQSLLLFHRFRIVRFETPPVPFSTFPLPLISEIEIILECVRNFPTLFEHTKFGYPLWCVTAGAIEILRWGTSSLTTASTTSSVRLHCSRVRVRGTFFLIRRCNPCFTWTCKRLDALLGSTYLALFGCRCGREPSSTTAHLSGSSIFNHPGSAPAGLSRLRQSIDRILSGQEKQCHVSTKLFSTEHFLLQSEPHISNLKYIWKKSKFVFLRTYFRVTKYDMDQNSSLRQLQFSESHIGLREVLK